MVGFLLLFALLFSTCTSSDNKCLNNDLQSLIDEKKNRSPPSWAVICLIREQDYVHYSLRNQALIEALAPYASLHPITILFFSEDPFPSTQIQEWQTQFQSIGKVKLIDVSSKGYIWPTTSQSRYGYKWMCKFFTVDLYEYLIDYDYYIRVDSDNIVISSSSLSTTSSSTTSRIFPYDIMKYVEDNQIQYGYIIRKYEPHQETRDTFPRFIQSYLEKCHITPTIPTPSYDFLFNFYNNFHIGKVSFFLQPKVRHFLVSTNTSGHLYKYRWGDSTIQATAIRLFMNPSHVQQLPNITYRHISHSNKLVTSDLALADKPIEIPQVFPDYSISTTTGMRVHGDWTKDPSLSDISIVKKGPTHLPPNKKFTR